MHLDVEFLKSAMVVGIVYGCDYLFSALCSAAFHFSLTCVFVCLSHYLINILYLVSCIYLCKFFFGFVELCPSQLY